VVYGAVIGGIRPLFVRKAKLTGDIEQLRGDIERAKTLISRVERTQADHAAVVRRILDSSSRHVLQARHGNYLIGARRIVEQSAAQAGVSIVSVTELGISTLELSAAPAGQAPDRSFKSYTAEVSARGSLSALVAMLDSIEKSNPFLCVSKLQVTAYEKDPQRHQVFLRIQWPIWADPEIENNLRGQLREIEEGAAEHSVAERAVE
jgi:hypothetical protein